ncbi:MAG: hypothetical protein GY760_26535 [Deltaproteobacteria bacterium]|nr:hypothetical protein [Deltaproteobacteria bacterium]
MIDNNQVELKDRAKRIIELAADHYKKKYQKSDALYLVLKAQTARRILNSIRPDKADLYALSFEAKEKGLSELELSKRIKEAEDNYTIKIGIINTALRRTRKRIDETTDLKESEINSFKYEMQNYIEKNLYFAEEKKRKKKKTVLSIVKRKLGFNPSI